MRRLIVLFFGVVLVGCTVGVKDLSDTEKDKPPSQNGIASTDEEKPNLTSEEDPKNQYETDSERQEYGSSRPKLGSFGKQSKNENHNNSSNHRYSTDQSIDCWNCKGGAVKRFTCQAQKFNTPDITPGISYYCKVGRLMKYNKKARRGEREQDMGLCPQCQGTRQSRCWICKGSGRLTEE